MSSGTSLASALAQLFDSKEDTDVTFIIKNEELNAHKIILINRSPVLRAMLKGQLAPANQRHEIKDPQIEYKDFENFLKFLYTENCEINAENVEALLHLSNMYDVPDLFQLCVEKVTEFSSESNHFKFAELGLLYNNKCDLLSLCLNNKGMNATIPLKYLKDSKETWISLELALEFVRHCPRSFCLNEERIFLKIIDWVKGQCEIQNLEVNPENVQEIFAPFKPHINFKKLSANSKKIVIEYNLISQNEIQDNFTDDCTTPSVHSSVNNIYYYAPNLQPFPTYHPFYYHQPPTFWTYYPPRN